MLRMLRIRHAIHLARTEPIIRSTAKPKKKPRNSLFQFRNFAVDDGRCAMKVGTDGVVLGLVAAEMILNGCLVNKQQSEEEQQEEQHGGTSSYLSSFSMLEEKMTGSTSRGRRDRHRSVLDIGVGSGLVSLILAQRLVETEVDAERPLGGPSASSSLTIVGTDVDEEALIAAERNFCSAILANASWQRQGVRFEGRRVLLGGGSSPCNECSSPTFPLDDWSPHAVACGAHQEEQDTSSSSFDIIVSNPPFFNPLKSWRDKVHGNPTKKKTKVQFGAPSANEGASEQQPQHAPDVFQQQRDAARLYDSLPPQDLAAQIFSRLRRPSPTMSSTRGGLSSSAVVIYPMEAMKTFLDSVASLNINTREAGHHDEKKQWCLELVHLVEIHDTVLSANADDEPPVRMVAHLQWKSTQGVQPQRLGLKRLHLPLHVSKVDRTFSEEYLRLAKHVYKINL